MYIISLLYKEGFHFHSLVLQDTKLPYCIPKMCNRPSHLNTQIGQNYSSAQAKSIYPNFFLGMGLWTCNGWIMHEGVITSARISSPISNEAIGNEKKLVNTPASSGPLNCLKWIIANTPTNWRMWYYLATAQLSTYNNPQVWYLCSF